ncbi:MAG: RNA polymerase sigma factor [Thermomicrobium sp.]
MSARLRNAQVSREDQGGVPWPAAIHSAPDTLLVEAAATGDAEAFATLYDRYVDRVYRHCYYRLGRRADAEDVTQETFLRAWRAIGRYRRTEAPFLAWLLTISDRLILSQQRSRRRVIVDEAVAERQSEFLDAEEEALGALASDAVRRALARLRPDRQQVLVLRFIDGLSLAEVAAALGRSESAVAVLQHRALADLRRELGYEPGRPRVSRVLCRLKTFLDTLE